MATSEMLKRQPAKATLGDAIDSSLPDDTGSNSSELKQPCRQLLDRLIRYQRLIRMDAPDMVVRNEQRLLHDTIEDIFECGDNTSPNSDPCDFDHRTRGNVNSVHRSVPPRLNSS